MENLMAKYTVKLTAPSGHSIPPLLQSFGNWLAKQQYGSVGYFELCVESVTEEWNPEAADRLARDGFSFLTLGEGSELVLLKTGTDGPPAVVLLGSEGETDTVATSLEEFLVLLGNGETGINDLDDEEATSLSKLRAWLAKNKVMAPKAPPFDFDAYLDGVPATAPKAEPKPGPKPELVAGLPPLIHQIATLVGRRADDPELVNFVTDVLGKKVPSSMTEYGGGLKYAVAPKKGIEMGFDYDIKNIKYPIIKKSKSSYVPYLSLALLTDKLPAALPFGVKFGVSVEELTSAFGPPTRLLGAPPPTPCWEWILDAARDIILRVGGRHITIQVLEASVLSRYGPCYPALGLFVAWAIQRDLIDVERFPDHAALLAGIRKRAQKGSALLDAAMPRGLWDIYLKDEPGLRHFAYLWFHNIGHEGISIDDDLIAVFGARKGPEEYDREVMVLDDDDWPAVDKATPTLDRRFGQWVKKAQTKTNRK
jgi:hypothetical protein